jgi:hypothetical protein
MPPCGLAIYDLRGDGSARVFEFDEQLGTILPVGRGFVLSLYRNPKLVDLATGKIIHVWTELNSGEQDGSIIRHLTDSAIPPPMAFDAKHKRFAILNGNTVTSIMFDCSVAGIG